MLRHEAKTERILGWRRLMMPSLWLAWLLGPPCRWMLLSSSSGHQADLVCTFGVAQLLTPGFASSASPAS